MKKIIIGSLLVMGFFSCASQPSCPGVDGFNPIIDPGCKVRIKNTLIADQLSPSIKEKMKQGQQLEFNWVPTEEKGSVTVPAHYEVKTVLGGDL